MNIHEAFIKLKENPNLLIKHNDDVYKNIDGKIYVTDMYKPLSGSKNNLDNNHIYFELTQFDWENAFTLEEVLSNDWEVVEWKKL